MPRVEKRLPDGVELALGCGVRRIQTVRTLDGDALQPLHRGLLLAGASATRVHYGSDTRADAILVGAFVAIWLSGHTRRVPPALVAVSGDLTIEQCTLCQGAPCGQEPDCDGWVASDGQFDDYGLGDPPNNPKQAPPPE